MGGRHISLSSSLSKHANQLTDTNTLGKLSSKSVHAALSHRDVITVKSGQVDLFVHQPFY